MKAIKFPECNKVLTAPRGQEEEVFDLPVCQTAYPDEQPCVISCWELSDEDIDNLIQTRQLWLSSYGHTHPPLVPLSKSPFT